MKELRSKKWFGETGKNGFIYRAWLKNQGIPDDQFDDKPVIGICNTWSELTPCNGHFRELAESIKKGVYEAGGIPFEFPVISLGEATVKPTAMLFRNLMSMDVEESIRMNPLDGVVLMCGCDKTTPATIMGAASVDLPTIVLSGGPMLTGRYKGKKIGTSDVWRYAEMARNNEMSQEKFRDIEEHMCRSEGHCAVMGTASTMACMTESLGLSLPQNASIPAADSRRKVLAQKTGRRIVEMVREDLRLSQVLTRAAFDNSIKINAAIGGSTNFIIHLLAIAHRIGVDIELSDFDHLSSDIPLLANLQPSGEHFMEDFFYAGGLPVLIKELSSLLDKNVKTVNTKSLIDNCKDAVCFDRKVIASIDKPFQQSSATAVVKGNLAKNGAVIKTSCATRELLKHKGKAVVFENIEDYKARIDSPELEVDENDILVLKNVGPKGYPGMPEVGNMGIPKKLLEKGVKDMVRISDARMSGTAFGTVFLHVSPEAAAGGNLALVKNGDQIEVDVEQRRLSLLVSDEELTERKKLWSPPELGHSRGYAKLYIDRVQQAHRGADLDFLVGSSGSDVKRDSH